MTIIEQLVGNIVKTGFKDFDAQVVESAKQRIIDIVECTIGGANTPRLINNRGFGKEVGWAGRGHRYGLWS